MKNAKKIGVALLIIALISVGVVVAVLANPIYTGDVAKLDELVAKSVSADTLVLKEEALTDAETYLSENPIDPESEGYSETLARYQTAKIDLINLYLAEIAKESTTLNNAVKLAEKSDKWYNSAFNNESGQQDDRLAATLAATHASNVKLSKELYDLVGKEDIKGNDLAAAKADAAYKRAHSFFTSRVFDTEAADYATLKADFDALTKLYTESKNARYQALLAEARMVDYAAKEAINNNFEGATAVPTVSNNKGYTSNGNALNNRYGKESMTLPDGSVNNYLAMHFDGALSSASGTSLSSTFFTLNFGGVVDRFVMEFDVTSFSTLPSNIINFQSRPSEGTNQWFGLLGNGDIVDHNSNVLAPGAVVPGEWTHVSLVCELANINQSRLYVDYAFVGYVKGDHKGYGYTPSNMRVGNAGNASGEICFDNIYVGFQGSICDKTYKERMGAAERFVFLCEYMQRTGSDEVFIKVPDCVIAYDEAKGLASQFGILKADGTVEYTAATEAIADEALKARIKKAVDDYYAYDPFDIILEYKITNILEYKRLLEAVIGSAHAPTSSSISNRNALIGKVDTFINTNGNYLLKVGDDFLDITEGDGLKATPYVLTHGNHPLSYTDSFGKDWAYYKYVATEYGILSFSAPGEGVVIARGTSVDNLAQLVGRSDIMIVHPGDEVWFGVKTEDGSVATGEIVVSATLTRVVDAFEKPQYVLDGDGSEENPHLIHHVTNTITHSVSYAKNTAAATYKYYLYEARMNGVIEVSVSNNFMIAYGPSIDELGDEVQSATIEVSAGDKLIFRVGNPSKIGSSAVTMAFTVTATRGLGTAENPYLVDRTNNTLTYAGGSDWAYYKYTAPASGILNVKATGGVVGRGYNAGAVSTLDADSDEIIVSEGDILWFGVRTADGSAAVIDVAFKLYDVVDYDKLLALYSSSLERIEQDQAILNFNTNMDIVERMSSAAMLQSKYAAATQIISDGINTSLLTEPGYALFNKHYTVTYENAPEKINSAIMDANAKSLILTINYITERYPDEEDWRLVFKENATTPEEIANNETYLFVENYVNLIRARIDGGAYNPFGALDDGTTVDMALTRFEAMNEYYYGILQSKHIEVISVQFEEFAKTSSYIEKKGIISYIQRYLNSESVDFYVELTCKNEACTACGVLYSGKVKDVASPSCPICDTAAEEYRIASDRPELYTMLKKYTAYEAELEPQAENYEELLNQNTIYFVNAVKRFDTAITYVEKRALLNEAMPYYYSMNISSDDVKEAIVRYDALAAELDAIENASLEFVICVITEMPAARAEYGEDGYYEKLVRAAILYENVDASVEGVDQLAEAIAQYKTELEAYKATIETANTEIAQATSMIGSLGANCGFTAIMSVVLKELLSFVP